MGNSPHTAPPITSPLVLHEEVAALIRVALLKHGGALFRALGVPLTSIAQTAGVTAHAVLDLVARNPAATRKVACQLELDDNDYPHHRHELVTLTFPHQAMSATVECGPELEVEQRHRKALDAIDRLVDQAAGGIREDLGLIRHLVSAIAPVRVSVELEDDDQADDHPSCSICHGTGSTDVAAGVACEVCDGTGINLSDDAKNILELFDEVGANVEVIETVYAGNELEWIRLAFRKFLLDGCPLYPPQVLKQLDDDTPPAPLPIYRARVVFDGSTIIELEAREIQSLDRYHGGSEKNKFLSIDEDCLVINLNAAPVRGAEVLELPAEPTVPVNTWDPAAAKPNHDQTLNYIEAVAKHFSDKSAQIVAEREAMIGNILNAVADARKLYALKHEQLVAALRKRKGDGA